MTRPQLTFGLLLSALVSGCVSHPPAQPHLLRKANVLPLALDESFSFRKQELWLNDRAQEKPTVDQMIQFEREHLNFGAVTAEERKARFGNYFSFWWRASRPAHLVARLEYRQQNLGAYVQAQEITVPVRKGTFEVKFKVTDDDYNQDGRVIAWRTLLIENGKIVALRQSFLWH